MGVGSIKKDGFMKTLKVMMLMVSCVLFVGCGVADEPVEYESRAQDLAYGGVIDGECAYHGLVTCCVSITCDTGDPIVHTSYQVHTIPKPDGARCPETLDYNVSQRGWDCKGILPIVDPEPPKETVEEVQ